MERWQYDRDLISWNWLSKSKYIISSNIAFNLFQKDKLILKQKQNKFHKTASYIYTKPHGHAIYTHPALFVYKKSTCYVHAVSLYMH